jgi:hypothetical protein
MADNETKQKEMNLGPFTKEERAYFDSKGETEIPQSPVASPPTGEESAQAPAPAGAGEPVPPPSEPENARMEERWRMLREANQRPPQPPAPPPSADTDIFAAVKHMQGEQSRTRTEIENYKRQIQAEDHRKALSDWGRNAESEFVAQNPDYYQALSHLRNARGRELAVWGMAPEAIRQQVVTEEMQLLARANAERRNPAQMAYDLARERGYHKGAPAAQSGNGALPPSTVDLNRIEAGQRQSASLSNVGGGAGRDTGDIEANDLLKMSDKEFGQWIDKHPAAFRRLKGATH